MTYPAYEKYKESGVPWLGQVPEGWEVERLKWSITLCKNGVWGSEPDGLDDIACIRVADFERTSLTVDDKNLTMRAIPLNDRKERLLSNSDLLLEKSGGGEKQLVGSVIQYNLQWQAVTSNFIARLVPSNKSNSRFLAYLHAHLYAGCVNYRSIKQTTGIQNLDDRSYLNEQVIYPPLSEQKAIAKFLDTKTAEIDALVAKKQELLKLLAEQRTALITHAVTKGLNPSAPMKDSGIDWLGHIPQHWEEKRLKFAVRLINDKVEASSVDLAYMGLEQIESWTGKRIPNEEAMSEGVVNVFKPKDVLFGKLRPYLAKVYLAEEEATCSTEAFVMRSTKQLLPDFLQLYMLTDKFINAVDATTYGAKMPRANWEAVGNLMMLLPPLEEQKEIVGHIRNNVSRIETVSSQVQEAIDRLKEYRTALITNAVTGKIKVV